MQKYSWVTTGDGSPSLQIEGVGELSRAEKMHSWEGAFSETLYVYGEVLQALADRKRPLRVFSLGLGLGYNELMTAGFVLSKQVPFESGVSTELDPWLIQQFQKWLEGQASELCEPYSQVCDLFAKHYGVTSVELRQRLAGWVANGSWTLAGGYHENFDLSHLLPNAVFYDAFSEKVSPELWTEGILKQTVAAMDKLSVFGTYASKGRLKRILKESGFQLMDRPGYGGKKESTLAIRLGF